MTRLKLLLLLVASCSILFMGLMALGGYYLAQHVPAVAVLCFLLGFVCALGQMGALALFLRERALRQWQRRQAASSVSSTESQTESHHE